MPRVTEKQAIELLRQGDLVALPTETVYGLAARIDRPESIAQIFAAKGRPYFNPLIVHTATTAEALSLAAEVSPLAQTLADHFWPGPLTLVLPRKPSVPSIVTAGQETVALRVPAHPMAQSVLCALGVPLAAPSANRSTTLSPTTADHVLASLGESVAVLDGGATARGLESTVVRIAGGTIEVLRLGSLELEELAAFAPVSLITETTGTPSPGMQLKHYAPSKPLQLVDAVANDVLAGTALLTLCPHANAAAFHRAEALSMSGDLVEAAARLFDVLHTLENDVSVRQIVAVAMPSEGLGLAINDRLRRGSER